MPLPIGLPQRKLVTKPFGVTYGTRIHIYLSHIQVLSPIKLRPHQTVLLFCSSSTNRAISFSGAEGETRTLNNLGLSQTPLPIGLPQQILVTKKGLTFCARPQ